MSDQNPNTTNDEGEEEEITLAFEDDPVEEEPPRSGLPPWVMTYADMMTLLLCFFVLVLSYAQVDAMKFKNVVQSMENAFGVQRDDPIAQEIPEGLSVIFQHFSAGKPDDTIPEEVRQRIVEEEREELEQKKNDTVGEQKQTISAFMQEEVDANNLDISQREDEIVITIDSNGPFAPGSIHVQDSFMPVLVKVQKMLRAFVGIVKINGHTDDTPFSGYGLSSNWGLSAARASSIAEILLEGDYMKYQKQFIVAGYADSEPLFPNNNEINRSRNRRVEIILSQTFENADGNSFRMTMLDKKEALEASLGKKFSADGGT